MDPLERLTRAFERFPGIGPRQARRFVQYLLSQSESTRKALAEDMRKLGSEVKQCGRCFRWYVKNGGSEKNCAVCADVKRDASSLFVIEKDADLDAVERSGYTGLYFVLGGVMPLAEEYPEKYIRAKELYARIEADRETLKEVILGLSATTEGDHTRLILQEKLLPLSKTHGFTLSSLGRGLSTGSELEYADPDTVAQALGNRH